MYTKYGWRIEVSKLEKGSYSFGIYLHSNDDWRNEREYFLSLCLLKREITFGKFHYNVDSIHKL